MWLAPNINDTDEVMIVFELKTINVDKNSKPTIYWGIYSDSKIQSDFDEWTHYKGTSHNLWTILEDDVRAFGTQYGAKEDLKRNPPSDLKAFYIDKMTKAIDSNNFSKDYMAYPKWFFFYGTYLESKSFYNNLIHNIQAQDRMLAIMVDNLMNMVIEGIIHNSGTDLITRGVYLLAINDILRHLLTGKDFEQSTLTFFDKFIAEFKSLYPQEFITISKFMEIEDEINPHNWYVEYLKARNHLPDAFSSVSVIFKHYPK